jgi:hypothetical protein
MTWLGVDGDIVARFDELALGKADCIVLDDLFDEGLFDGPGRGVCRGCEVSADDFKERRVHYHGDGDGAEIAVKLEFR